MSTTVSTALICVIYLRVSTEEQAKSGYSLPEQKERCLSRARDLAGLETFTPVIIEDAAGGDLLERPGLSRVREFVREHRPRYFVCMDPDRFSRELFLQLLVTKEIEAAGTDLIFVQHDYQKTPEGQLFYALRGAISQFEKAKILERTKVGLRRKIQTGQVANGTQPFGYRYDTDHDTLAIYEAEAEWVKQIFSWARERLAPMQICDRLNALGVSTKRGRGRLWRSSTVQSMLRNTTYIGQMRCLRWNTAGYKAQRQLPKEKRTVTPKQRPIEQWQTVPVPPIIDSDLFQAVQETFRVLKRQSRRGKGVLSGLAVCGLCGAPIHYISDRSIKHGYVLRCHHRYPRRDALVKVARCTLPHVAAHVIEEAVWAELTEWVAVPEDIVARIRLEQQGSANQERLSQLERELSSFQKALLETRQEQATTLSMVAKRLVVSDVGEAVLAEQTNRMEALAKNIREAESRMASLRSSSRAVEAFKEQLLHIRSKYDEDKIRYTMARTDPAGRQYLLRFLVREVEILPGRAVKLHANLPRES